MLLKDQLSHFSFIIHGNINLRLTSLYNNHSNTLTESNLYLQTTSLNMQIEIQSFFSGECAIQLVTDKVYSVPGYEPIPLMRFFNRPGKNESQVLIAASIGALQWTLKSRAELDKFITEAIPTFCTPSFEPVQTN